MRKILRILLSKWILLIIIVALLLLVMPSNSPVNLPFPDYTKPTIAVISIMVIWELFFIRASDDNK